jgi:uncharacterized membrane protein YhaH (DUF805 family)
MDFQQAIRSGFSNYANFRSRACRSEFWYWQLFTLLASMAALLLDYAVDPNSEFFSGVWSLATILPDLAVAARRLHDTDRSGWWILLCFLPFIGWAVLIVLFCFKGTPGQNRFGADPSGAGGLVSPRPAA